jgi:hypothetical protein
MTTTEIVRELFTSGRDRGDRYAPFTKITSWIKCEGILTKHTQVALSRGAELVHVIFTIGLINDAGDEEGA